MSSVAGMKLLNIRQQLPFLNIEPARMPQAYVTREHGGLEVDQTAGRRSMGMYPPIELGQRLADLSREAVMEAIARIAQEGDRYAAIHTGENVVVELAVEAMFRSPNIVLQPPPSEPPRMRYIPDHVMREWETGEVSYRMGRDGKIIKLWLSDYNVNRDFNLEG